MRNRGHGKKQRERTQDNSWGHQGGGADVGPRVVRPCDVWHGYLARSRDSIGTAYPF